MAINLLTVRLKLKVSGCLKHIWRLAFTVLKDANMQINQAGCNGKVFICEKDFVTSYVHSEAT